MTAHTCLVPSTERDLFVGTGQWREVESDREGRRCAIQEQQTITGRLELRAYFSAQDGRLCELFVVTSDGQRLQYDPTVVAALAAQAAQAAAESSATDTHGRARRFTWRR